MTSSKNSRVVVQNTPINITNVEGEDYICLTDMVRNIGGSTVIEKWFRNKNTLEFLGVWEALNNPRFKTPEFEGIRNQAGTNRFVLSVKQWIEATAAVGVRAQSGRYGGTYAHKDIAFEFGAWVSPEFKLMLIKEFQRLKDQELLHEHWDYRRFLAKVNYRLQTSAISESIIQPAGVTKDFQGYIYAEEADIVNLALFGHTAKEWRQKNPKLAKKGMNVRDAATIEQLTVLANLESLNSMFISQGLSKGERFRQLAAEAARQVWALVGLGQPDLIPGGGGMPNQIGADSE